VALDLPPRKTLKRVVEKYKPNTIFPHKTMLGGEETKSILKTRKPFLKRRYYSKLVATSVKCNIFIDFVTSQFRRKKVLSDRWYFDLVNILR
jgi:hypothetical protein